MKDSGFMKKIRIYDISKNQNIDISIIRYFKYENEEYIFYYDEDEPVLNEQRIFVYVAKLRDKVSTKILDSEWRKVYNYLKMIGYAAKEGKEIRIQDLEINPLDGVIINCNRTLSMNFSNLQYFMDPNLKREKTISGIREVKRVPVTETKSSNINYQNLYIKEHEENEKLKKRIIDLESLTLSYQLNLQQINDFLKENVKK